MGAWWEDDAFWAGMEPVLFDETRLADAAAEVDGLLALVAPPAGAAVLDVPCGVGRHASELARRGYRVTGVDRTARYLERARELERTAGAAPGTRVFPVDWIEGDMREPVREEAFDVALSLYSSFGYFEDPGDDRRVARALRRSLRPGGACVLDVKSREVQEATGEARRTVETGAGPLEETVAWIGESRVEVRWTVASPGDAPATREAAFRIRLYGAEELVRLLAEAGFAVTRVYGSLAGAPYDPTGRTARRLVAVARC